MNTCGVSRLGGLEIRKLIGFRKLVSYFNSYLEEGRKDKTILKSIRKYYDMAGGANMY